jgi:3-hydroxy-3-methylglutaryl CoA synthase
MASLAALFQRLLTIAIGDEPPSTQLQPPSTGNTAAVAGAAGVSGESGVERTSNENDTLVISAEEIKVEVATAMVADDGAGAISVFVGTTRDNFQGE